jgi:hypothetical protein
MKKFLFIFIFGICTINLSFAQWQSLGNGFDDWAGQYHLSYDSSNSILYVGGYFSYTADSLHVKGIAQWNGVSWDSLAGGISGGPAVQSMSIYRNKLHVSGCCFGHHISNMEENWLGIWNGNSWDTLTQKINGNIEVMKEYNGDLYLGGPFDRIGYVKHHLLAKLSDTTYSYYPFGSQAGGYRVNAIEFYQGNMYVGGNFYDTITGVNDLEVWDGNSFQAFGGNGLGFGGSSVHAMVVYNNELYIAGGFEYVSGPDTFHNIMRWDGTQFLDVSGGINYTLSRLVMKIINGEIYICGALQSAGNIPIHNYIAKWNGNTWSEVFSDTIDGQITDFLLVNNDLYIAGNFKHINGVTFNHIAKYSGFVNINELKPDKLIINFSNPVHKNVYIELSKDMNVKYELIDMYGKLKMNGSERGKRFHIDVSELAAGIYLLHVSHGDVNETKKFVLFN